MINDDTFTVDQSYFSSSKYDYVVYMHSKLDLASNGVGENTNVVFDNTVVNHVITVDIRNNRLEEYLMV